MLKLTIMKSLIFSIFLFTMISCKKNEFGYQAEKNKVFNSKLSLEQLIAANNNPSFGNVSFQESTSIAGGDRLPLGISINASFWDKQNKKNKAVHKRITIDGNELVPSPDFMSYQYHLNPVTDLNNLFGRKIRFKADGGNNARSSSLDDSVYIPEQIRLDFPGFIPFGSDSGTILSASNLYSGLQINWNADDLNTSGVFLFVEYFPDDAGNKTLKANGYDESQHNWILVDDIGTFTLTSELFEDIPNGARVRFSIARGGYNVIWNENYEVEDYRVFGFSVQQDNFRYVMNP